MPPAAPASAAVHAPQAPVSAPVSAKAQAEFMQLKSLLNNLASWDLAPADWDRLAMHFTEAGNEQQAQAVVQALQ
ncbi:Uncharacterised protein [uncultured archaeon]|nr:Uncharacterised protein [uncultured archaeon]